MSESESGTSRKLVEQRASLAQLIVSVLALYARGQGNWLSVAVLVELMEELGVEGQAVRSAISRLKRRGVLLGQRRDGMAGYALSKVALEVVAEGDVRIFERARATPQDGWVIVVFSVPETERNKRHALRSGLSRLGYGTAAPGVWIAPATLVDETKQALSRSGLCAYVDLFVGTYASGRDLCEEIRTWWNIGELSDLYEQFLREHRASQEAAERGDLNPQLAFRIYVPMLTKWRRLPYRDPGIPLALLPDGWKGEEAAALFRVANEALRPLAQRHALSIIRGS